MEYTESRASEHSVNVELEIKKLQKKFRDLRITYFYDDEDLFIDMKQYNKTTNQETVWSFCVDFGNNSIYMLDPREKILDYFSYDNEIAKIIADEL